MLRIDQSEMNGGVLFIEDRNLYAMLPDGRKICITSDSDCGSSWIVFEEW